MNPVRICHITTSDMNHIPRLLRECASARSAGMEAYIVAPGESHSSPDGTVFIGVKEAPNRLYRMLVTARAMYRAARQTDSDIYQLHDPEFLPFAGKFLRMGKRVIFDSHEFYGLQIREKAYLPLFFRNIIANAYLRYEERVCKKIDAVLSVCTVEGRDYFEGRAKKEVMIQNMLLLDDECVYSADYMAKVSQEKNVVYAGLLSPARGITQLVRAAMQTPATLLLCGMFVPAAYRDEILAFAKPDKVKYLGTLNKKELFSLYLRCAVGLSTLLDIGQYAKIDTLPTKVYEYMAAGIPVVVSDFPYIRKLVEKYQFGICVDPGDPEAIRGAVEFLLDHPDEAARMGQNGRRAVVEELNWSTQEKKLLELYASLLGGGR